jgi:hypothetical protein
LTDNDQIKAGLEIGRRRQLDLRRRNHVDPFASGFKTISMHRQTTQFDRREGHVT